MRMLPTVINPATRSRAEKKLFRVLQALDAGQPCTCFHSLNLTRHGNKRFSEADFVIVHRFGIFVLEVKGGGVARHENGEWVFTSSLGEAIRKREGPFEQAHGALMALRRRMEESLGHGLLAGVPLGYGVVVPDCVFNVQSVEWEPWMVADSRQTDALGSWLRNLMMAWKGRTPGSAKTLADRDIEAICSFLRPSFERVPSLHSQILNSEEQASALTESQTKVIDCLTESRQILCQGGAGTGKTFLAAELARRWSWDGQETLMVVKTPWLSSYLKPVIKAPGLSLRTIDSLRLRPPSQPFPKLIVDEGQDLLNMEDLDILDRSIEGGLAEGRWAFFYDMNNQAGIVGKCDPEALGFLKQSGPVPLALRENCRNTETILSFIQERTRCDMGTRGSGPGPKVELLDPKSEVSHAKIVENTVRRLLENRVPRDEITILTAVPCRESCLQESARLQNYEILDEISVAQRPYSNVTVASIPDFKGLENNVIIVTDLNKIADHDQRRTLAYVGMSRARAYLALILDPVTEQSLSRA